jgi:hypothetical protein
MNDQPLDVENMLDKDGNPASGLAQATGLTIVWQNGPLGRGEDQKKPNGCFIETVIRAAKQRLEFFQTACNGKFACGENGRAISHLFSALEDLNRRTCIRDARGVEGTYEA